MALSDLPLHEEEKKERGEKIRAEYDTNVARYADLKDILADGEMDDAQKFDAAGRLLFGAGLIGSEDLLDRKKLPRLIGTKITEIGKEIDTAERYYGQETVDEK